MNYASNIYSLDGYRNSSGEPLAERILTDRPYEPDPDNAGGGRNV